MLFTPNGAHHSPAAFKYVWVGRGTEQSTVQRLDYPAHNTVREAFDWFNIDSAARQEYSQA